MNVRSILFGWRAVFRAVSLYTVSRLSIALSESLERADYHKVFSELFVLFLVEYIGRSLRFVVFIQ